jgi:lipoprotein-releasing system permease protein
MSRLPFEIFLALRYFRPKGTYVSVMTLIAAVGVMLAVGMLIIVIAVMTGFDHDLRERILGFNAHLKVFAQGTTLHNSEQVRKVVAAHPDVRGAAPFVFGQVLVETQPATGNATVGAPWVRGIDPQNESTVTVLPKSVVAGKFNLEGRSLLVGREFAHNMGLYVGDRLAVYSPRNIQEMRQARGKTNEVAILPDDYVINGIFDVGHYEYNATVIVTSLDNAQDLYDLDNSVHGLMVMVKDPFQVDRIRTELEARLGKGYKITLWTEENSGILNALMVEKQAMFVVLFVIMVVAAFGIMSTLIAFVFQKTRDVGILKTLGATRLQIAALFVGQSALVGLVGVSAGLVFGRTLLAWRNEFLDVMNRLTGFELFPAAIYTFDRLPAMVLPLDVTIICGSAFLLCILAGVLPAWKAASLHPVEALRHE